MLSPASFRPVPSKCRLIGAQLVELRCLCQRLQSGQPGRLVGLIQGGAAARCARGRGRRCGRLRSSLRRARRRRPALPRRIAAQSSSAAGQGQRHRGRPGLDLRPRLGRRQAGQIDPGLAEGVGIGGVGDRAVRVVGLGRADVDQAIEQGLVAPGRIQPGLDLLVAGPASWALAFGSPAASACSTAASATSQRGISSGFARAWSRSVAT